MPSARTDARSEVGADSGSTSVLVPGLFTPSMVKRFYASRVERKMKTTFLAIMTMVATLTILCARPVLAQTGGGYPAETSPDRETTPVVGAVNVGPSRGDPALAPAPEDPMDAYLSPTSEGYTPVHPVSPAEPWMEPPESRFAQPFVSPASPATGQMRELPPIGLSQGGFYRPVRCKL